MTVVVLFPLSYGEIAGRLGHDDNCFVVFSVVLVFLWENRMIQIHEKTLKTINMTLEDPHFSTGNT